MKKLDRRDVDLTQTGAGYSVRTWAGNKVISHTKTTTLKDADKAVTNHKRKAMEVTGQRPRVK